MREDQWRKVCEIEFQSQLTTCASPNLSDRVSFPNLHVAPSSFAAYCVLPPVRRWFVRFPQPDMKTCTSVSVQSSIQFAQQMPRPSDEVVCRLWEASMTPAM